MDLLPGFETPAKKGMVRRLRKSLYGLKQSPKAWFDRFTNTIRRYGYKQAHADNTLFFRRSEGKVNIIIVYVMISFSPAIVEPNVTT